MIQLYFSGRIRKQIGLVLAIGFLGLVFASKSWAQTNTPSPTVSVEATGSADSTSAEEIKQKVQERLTKAAQQKKAYVGVLTDIADATLRINTRDGIKMAATSDKTLFYRTENGIQAKVKINDMPLNQLVIAMGYLENGNGGGGQVLSAIRVISSPTVTADTRLVKVGTVTDLTKSGEFKLVGVSGESYQVKVDSKTGYTAVKDKVVEPTKIKPKEGDKIIVVGVPDKKLETTMTASLVHIVTAQVQSVTATPTPLKKAVSPTP